MCLLTVCRAVRATSCVLHKAVDHILSWRSQSTSYKTSDMTALYAYICQTANTSALWLKAQTFFYENTQAGTKHVPHNGMKAAYKSILVRSKTSGAQINVYFHFLQL